MNKVIAVITAIILVAVIVVETRERRTVGLLKVQNSKLTAELAQARQDAGQAPKGDPQEAERINQERTELARLRGEVSALRKEKAEWQKSRGVAETAAIATAQPAVANPTVDAMQWVETVLNGPAQMKGTEAGNARRKALNGEPMSEAERALLMNMNSKSAEVEKSPEEFANFQSAFIGSLLGWTTDARTEQLNGILNAAMTAAVTRGYDYHAPSENADKWTDEQKALNTRATTAIQNILRPEERAVFDKALIGVLGVDTGTK